MPRHNRRLDWRPIDITHCLSRNSMKRQVMARKLGVSEATLLSWENGISQPNTKNERRLVNFLMANTAIHSAVPEEVAVEAEEEVTRPNPYKKVIKGVELDVYDIAEAYDVPFILGHAIKKLLCLGRRSGGKSVLHDLEDVRDTINRAIEIVKERQDE